MGSALISDLMTYVQPWLSTAPAIIVVMIWVWIISSQFLTKPYNDRRDNVEKESDSTQSRKSENKASPTIVIAKIPKKKPQFEKWSKESKHSFSHEWLITSLKGHTGPILDMDFSPNGKFLATCAQDRAIFIWSTKDWKEKEHKFLRYNVELDHASILKWSPDTKALVYKRQNDNVIEVCRVARKQDGWISALNKSVTYENMLKDDIVSIGVDVKGRYIMTCTAGTEILLTDIKGVELSRFDTYLMNNFTAKLSPCGRFIAASGFAPDLKVWEVQFTKTGEFKQVSRAFELTGHSSGIYDFAFNVDSSRIATVSRDGSWKLFNIKIEFDKGEGAHLLLGGKYVGDSSARVRLALSPDSNVLAIAAGSSVSLYNLIDGNLDTVIENLYPGDVTKVGFDASGEMLLTCGERHVRILRNVTGIKTAREEARRKLAAGGPSLSSATKERLEETMAAADLALRPYLPNTSHD